MIIKETEYLELANKMASDFLKYKSEKGNVYLERDYFRVVMKFYEMIKEELSID